NVALYGHWPKDNLYGDTYGPVSYMLYVPFRLIFGWGGTWDSLPAAHAALIFALLAIRTAPARGLMAGLAGMTKFAPFALAPLLLRGTEQRLRKRHILGFGIAFALACVLTMLPVLLKNDLSAFWHDSILYQSDRTTPFSVWGLWGGLGWLQSLLQGAVIALALGVAFVPSRRTVVDVAALGAGVLIALQLTL